MGPSAASRCRRRRGALRNTECAWVGGGRNFLEHLARRRELTHILTSGHVNGASEEKQVGRGLFCIFTH